MSRRAYEISDASPKMILIGVACVVGALVLALGLAAALVAIFGHADPRREPIAHAPPPEPRLEVTPGAVLAAVDKRGSARLSGYGWSDPAAGLARIPIARAMQITAQRGWTDRQAGQ